MKIIDNLKKAIFEAELNGHESELEIDQDSFKVQVSISTDENNVVTLNATISLDPIEVSFVSKKNYSEITDEQFNDASRKLEDAVKKVITEFYENFDNKMASYGLEKKG